MSKTIAEISEQLGVDKTATGGFVSFLRAKGVLTEGGSKKREDGKGKAATLYVVAEDAEEKLQEILDKLRE